jgi:uncharacterized protein with von Willebrand factor type A (vWA) domain
VSDLVTATTRLCRSLRARGVLVTPAESADALRTLAAVDIGDRSDVYLALRATLASRREDYAPFDELFDQWWRGARDAFIAAPSLRPPTPAPPKRREIPSPSAPRPPRAPSLFLQRWAAPSEGEDDEAPAPVAAPSVNEAMTARDFSTFAADELAAVERAAAQLARRLSARPSRRWKPARRGARVHLRRTIRLSLKTGGDAAELARRERKLRKTKLVALCDVSGSMDLYSRFLLQFLFALQRSFARVETFVFSTRLTRITPQLARDTYREALDELARHAPGWSGGTKIGESIAAFADGWPRLLDRRTVVIVLSDGWDTGEPAVLAEALRGIRRRTGRVIWLNPLLGSPGYRPLTRGMQAALPHVDVFAPVHNVESLNLLARHLTL